MTIYTLSAGEIERYQNAPLPFFIEWLHREPELAVYRIGKRTVYQVNDPALVRAVLVTQADAYQKSFLGGRARHLLGEGLITAQDELWSEQRVTAQPWFTQAKVEAWQDAITRSCGEHFAQWSQTPVIDVSRASRALFASLLAEMLFALDIGKASDQIDSALQIIMQFLRWGKPLITEADYLDAVAVLDAVLAQAIAQRGDVSGDDLLTRWQSQGLSAQALRDRLMTIFIAGQETLTNSFSWALYELTRQPQMIDRLRADEAVIQQAIKETLRLYPSAWMLGRQAVHEAALGQHSLPAGAMLMLSPYIVHRHPQYWPDADTFALDRDYEAAYFPFGAGKRQCIGRNLALFVLPLCLKILLQSYAPQSENQAVILPTPAMNLRPESRLEITLVRQT